MVSMRAANLALRLAAHWAYRLVVSQVGKSVVNSAAMKALILVARLVSHSAGMMVRTKAGYSVGLMDPS